MLLALAVLVSVTTTHLVFVRIAPLRWFEWLACWLIGSTVAVGLLALLGVVGVS